MDAIIAVTLTALTFVLGITLFYVSTREERRDRPQYTEKQMEQALRIHHATLLNIATSRGERLKEAERARDHWHRVASELVMLRNDSDCCIHCQGDQS